MRFSYRARVGDTVPELLVDLCHYLGVARYVENDRLWPRFNLLHLVLCQHLIKTIETVDEVEILARREANGLDLIPVMLFHEIAKAHRGFGRG